MADMGIPPPPPEESLYGSAPAASNVPPPPPEEALYGSSNPIDRLGHDIHGAYQSALFNGFGGFVARHMIADTGPVGSLTRGALGMTQTPTQDQVNQAVTNIRNNAAQEQQANAFNINIPNPFVKAGKTAVDPVAFGAGVVGGVDPTYLINPAEGAMKSATINGITNTALRTGAKAAVNVGSHAAMMSATDAAYQTADMIDGLQQNFDVDRNLHAAELGAGFGAVHSAAPFVKQLFKQRNGIDTTPSENPQGTTNPLSDQGLNPQQAAQYAELLKTGNQQDIHNFFNDKNVVPPSHADINDFVSRRDSQTPLSEQDPNQLAQGMLGQPDNRQVVLDHVNDLTSTWKNKPNVEVINHTDDIQDPEVQAQAKAANADDPNALGFYGSDGTIRLFANKMTSAEDINAALYHEALGHAGLANAFGDRLDSTLNTLMDRNVGQFGKAVDAELAANGAEYNGNRTRAAEEVLANMSEQGALKPAISDAIEAQIRQFGRKAGLDLSYSDAEVRSILQMAHQSMIDGNGRDVAGNGFATAPKQAVQAYHATDLGQSTEIPPPPPEAALSRPSDGFQTPEEIAQRNAVPTTAEQEALNGPYVAKPEEFPAAERYPNVVDRPFHVAKDGFMTPEQIAEANRVPTTAEHEAARYDDLIHNPLSFMKRSDLAASKDYVAKDLEGIYKALDRDYVPETRSFEDDRRMALELGIKPSAIKDLADFGKLSTTLYRLQAAANMADIKLAALHEKLDTPEWTMADQGKYLQVLADRDYLINRIKGNRAEVARALNVSKAASSYSLATMKAVADKMREEGSGLASLADDPVKFMKFARQIKNLFNGGNPQGAHAKIAGVNAPYWEQYLNSFHFNAMLSGLSTHVKAPIDMGTGLAREVFEKALAMPIGAIRRAVQGGKGEVGVTPNELALHTYAMAKSFMNMEVYKAMSKAAVTGEGGYVDPTGTFKPVNMMNQYGSVSNPDLGPVLSLPSHLVAAQDIFFRSHGMMANMYALAAREAQKQLGPKATFDDINVRASAIAHQPTAKLLDDAKELTDRALLLNHNKLNDWFNKARTYGPNMTPTQRFVAMFANTLAPFVRVESNSLINRVVQRSPLALLDPYTLGQIKMGGPQADIAIAKILYGTVALGMAWTAAGKLSGNVSLNPNKRAELEAGGEIPRSIHENGANNQSSNLAMSLFPWDQHNATAQIVKSARDAFESKSGATTQQKMTGIKLAMESILHNMADMSWMAEASPAIDALTSNEAEGPGKIARFIGDEAKTFVPNALAQTVRLTDNKRDVTPADPTDISGTVINNVKSAIPGLAQTLPVKYNVYGQPTPTGATPEGVHNWLGEGNNVKDPTDPAIAEMARLAKLTPMALVTPTQKTIKIAGVGVKLTPEQAEDYQKYAGQTITEAVRSAMQDPSWSQQDDASKAAFLRQTQIEAKKEVREALIQHPGWLNEDQLNLLRNRLGAK